MYPITRTLPVARFLYKGNHKNPVRRTILVIENDSNYIVGYELREGLVTRPFKKSPVKTYRKDRIQESSLSRVPLIDLVTSGV